MTELARHSIAVAMSGGVDSLRAAVLLKEHGYDVVGLFMILSPRKKGSKADPSARTKALGQRFDIPVVVVDLERDFEQFVTSPFVEAYLKGLTPNPCVVCNPKIKFGFLLNSGKQTQTKFVHLWAYLESPNPFWPQDTMFLLFVLKKTPMVTAMESNVTRTKRKINLTFFTGYLRNSSNMSCSHWLPKRNRK